jgi:hypothetical protein
MYPIPILSLGSVGTGWGWLGLVEARRMKQGRETRGSLPHSMVSCPIRCYPLLSAAGWGRLGLVGAGWGSLGSVGAG